MAASKVVGVPEVVRDLGHVSGRLADLTPAFRGLGDEGRRVAYDLMPVDTAALRASLAYEVDAGGLAISVGAGLAYDFRGWPAVKAAGQAIDGKAGQAITATIDSAIRKVGLQP